MKFGKFFIYSFFFGLKFLIDFDKFLDKKNTPETRISYLHRKNQI